MNGESGPSRNPSPVASYPEPVFRYRPDAVMELPFFHGDKYKPLPAGTILKLLSPFLMYIIPEPSALETPVLAKADIAPVAKAGATVFSRNGATVLPKIPRSVKILPPPSCYELIELYSF